MGLLLLHPQTAKAQHPLGPTSVGDSRHLQQQGRQHLENSRGSDLRREYGLLSMGFTLHSAARQLLLNQLARPN